MATELASGDCSSGSCRRTCGELLPHRLADFLANLLSSGARVGIQSLPEAVYERDDVYLMSEQSLTPFLVRCYEEHLAVSVRFEPIYAMPNPHHLAGYDGNYLFKVSPAP